MNLILKTWSSKSIFQWLTQENKNNFYRHKGFKSKTLIYSFIAYIKIEKCIIFDHFRTKSKSSSQKYVTLTNHCFLTRCIYENLTFKWSNSRFIFYFK